MSVHDSNLSQQDQESIHTSHHNQIEHFFRIRLGLMYQCPPNDEHAEIHRASSAFGYNPNVQPGEKVTICPCCELPINTITLPITIPTTPITGAQGQSQFFALDSGAAMFFTFIKMAIIYLCILFVVCNIYPLHLSYLDKDYCLLLPNECGSSWFINFSPVKFSKTSYAYNYEIMNVLNFIMVVSSVVFFVIYRKYQYDIYGMLDLHNLTQDDFTVIVKYIPSEAVEGKGKVEELLKRMLEEKVQRFIGEVRNEEFAGVKPEHLAFRKILPQIKTRPEELDKIKSVSLCFDLKQMKELIDQRDKLIEEHLKSKPKKKNQSQSISEQQESIQAKIQDINNRYLSICKSYLQNSHQQGIKSHFIGKAFVSFEFQHYRNYILRLYQSNPQLFTIEGHQLKISQAAHPSDIYWYNLKVDKWTRVKRICISYLAPLIILVIVFAVITIIQVGQQVFSKSQEGTGDDLLHKGITYGATVAISLLVYWVNYLFGMIIKYMTNQQKHQTKTKYLISLIIKMFAAVFLNTAVMFFLLSLRQGQHYLMDDGLVVQISNLMIISGLISIPLNFFQIDSKIQGYWRKFRYGFLDHDSLFQVQYNEICQLPQFDFADRYCFYLVQLFTLLFYSYINPICVPAIIIIASVHYWIDKYNLLKCSSNTFPMNFVISRAILKIFELSIVAFAVGNYYFGMRLNEGFRLINFVALMIAAGYAVLAIFSPAYIEEKVFGSQHEIETKSYTEAMNSGAFKQVYWSCNPATVFLQEPNINKPGEFVSYSLQHKIARLPDLQECNQRASVVVFE